MEAKKGKFRIPELCPWLCREQGFDYMGYALPVERTGCVYRSSVPGLCV